MPLLSIPRSNLPFKFDDDTQTRILRYVEFWKFESMIESKSLYFSRADLLGDPFECSIPQSHFGKKYTQEEFKEMRNKHTYNTIIEQVNELSKEIYVSCWTINSRENDLMWKAYVQGNEGVSIQSTVGRFDGSLGDPCIYDFPYMGMSKVKYIDDMRERLDGKNILEYVMYKRKEFEDDRELRAVIWNDIPDKPKGICVPVDLSILIETIYIAPTANFEFHEKVESVVKKYLPNVVVKSSALSKKPLR